MPLYDYKCDGCGETTDSFESSDTMEIPCPKCVNSPMKRLFPIPQKPKEGVTLADGRIRDKMKGAPRSAAPSAMFDRGDPRKKF
jgi:putative FmdB family regulatory protein